MRLLLFVITINLRAVKHGTQRVVTKLRELRKGFHFISTTPSIKQQRCRLSTVLGYLVFWGILCSVSRCFSASNWNGKASQKSLLHCFIPVQQTAQNKLKGRPVLCTIWFLSLTRRGQESHCSRRFGVIRLYAVQMTTRTLSANHKSRRKGAVVSPTTNMPYRRRSLGSRWIFALLVKSRVQA